MTKDLIVQGLNRISEMKDTLPYNDRKLIKAAADLLAEKARLMSINDLFCALLQEDAIWLEYPTYIVPRLSVVQITKIDIPDDRSRIDSITFSNGFTDELLTMGEDWRCWNIKPEKIQMGWETWVSQRAEAEKAIENYLSYRNAITFDEERRRRRENFIRRSCD